MRVFTQRWIPGLAIAVALLFRAVYFIQIRANPYFEHPVMDEGFHDLWAREIAAGDWAGKIPFFRAPLYPYLLGLAYRLLGAEDPPFALLRAVQLLLGAITPWITYQVARRLLPGRPAVAAISSLVVALDGILLYFEGDLLLESLLAPMGTLLALLLLRAGESGSARRWLAVGAGLGLFAITRPNILLFAPVALALALGWRGESFSLRRPRVASGIAVTLGTCLFVLPVTGLNWWVGGDRVLVASQAGLNFFLGNNPEANGWSATAPSILRLDWWGGYEDAITIAESEAGRDLRPSEVSEYWFDRAFRFWREEPGAAITVTIRKASYFLCGIEFSNNRDIRLFLRDWAPIAYPSLFLFFAVLPLAVAGAISVWRGEGLRGRAVLLLVVVYAVSVVAFFVTARYRVPIRPLLVVLAVEGVRRLAIGLRARDRAIAVGAAGVVVLGVAVNANPWTFEYRPTPAQYHQSIANVYLEEGDMTRALEHQLRVLEIEPAYPEGNLNLGTMYLSMGDLPGALHAFERERTLDPEDGKNLASLAQVLTRLNRIEEAERRYAEAEAVGLEDAPALYNHGVLLERLGREPEAEAIYRRAVASDSTFVDGWNNLGVVLARADRLEEAVDCWERVLRLVPRHPDANQNLRRSREILSARGDQTRKE